MHIMKKMLFLLASIAALSLLPVGCQQDEDKVEQNPQNLNRQSELTTLLSRIAASDAGDNTIDSTACFSIKMPYTVWIHDMEGNNMTSYGAEVHNESDLEEVKETINSFGDEDYFRLQFPVTIVYNDGSEAIANNANELHAFKSQCETGNPANSTIACLSIVYPITIYGYNSNFQLAHTYHFNNDGELLDFLMNLDSEEYYALDFPINITVDSQIVAIHNNQELLSAIQTAMNDCFPVVNPCNNPNVLVDSLVVYMPFANEARDLITNVDAIHNDNYPPVFVTDRSGNTNSAVAFSGADLDYLKLSADNGNNINHGPISISLWFKANNTNESDLEHLFEKSDGGQTNPLNFGLALYDLNRPLFYANQDPIFNLWDGSWNMQTDNTEWHHLVVTVDDGVPSAEVKLYRDGIFIGSAESPDPIFINTQIFDYYFGRKFKGNLDDIRVYRRKLTSTEVNKLFMLEGDNNTCVN
jgi:concanavalin A-like lectin/glucanase superfamily protein